MYAAGREHPHRAPAVRFLERTRSGDHPHGQDVRRTVGFQKFGEIITEADEAVRSASEELAVDPDLAVQM